MSKNKSSGGLGILGTLFLLLFLLFPAGIVWYISHSVQYAILSLPVTLILMGLLIMFLRVLGK
jgi:hypothetical protein